ncbi:hypothetical protein Tco_0496380 [Tanacetum coccineum]
MYNHNISSVDVAQSHGGEGGGEDRPPPHHVSTDCGGCFINRGKGKRKPNLGGRGAGRMNTRDKTRNLSLKDVAKAKGPVSIQFDVGDKQTLNPLGPHAAHWSNYIGEVIRTVPLYYPSWEKVPKERKAALISNIRVSYPFIPSLTSGRTMESPVVESTRALTCTCKKAYNTNKASFKAKHWRVDPQTGTYDVEAIRQTRPEEITADEWDKQASDTQEYPSRIDTFWRTHTVDVVFPKDEDSRIYEEMKRLEATGEYTEDEIN